jgi:hypothetical protein
VVKKKELYMTEINAVAKKAVEFDMADMRYVWSRRLNLT